MEPSGFAEHEDSNIIDTMLFCSRIFVVEYQKAETQPYRGPMARRIGIAADRQANLVLRTLLGESA
jgi:hypothetical protein